MAAKAENDRLGHGGVLEELGGQGGGEQLVLAKVRQAGVAGRQELRDLQVRLQAGEDDLVQALGASGGGELLALGAVADEQERDVGAALLLQ